MTPKEKARELVDKIKKSKKMPYQYVKECALMLVNEIINSNPHSNPLNTDIYSTMGYWQEVKQEIQKL